MMITEVQHVAIPAPRTPAARPAIVPMTVRAARVEQDEHPELVAARLVSQAATVSWVGRLALLVAVGLVAVLVLVP
ncbi:hypothetical protein [Actinomycetospora flava]|uniref:Uncharacterized protein n=1 Tax=Actinomycetospora flava TaxID=3129232 RepID=A0ABU8M2V5_9PSEU